MTVDQKIDLIESRPFQGPRCMIPAGRMRFVVESAESRWLVRLERWAARKIAEMEKQSDAEVKYYIDVP